MTMTNKIIFHRDDLMDILRFVDEIGSLNETCGHVTVLASDTSSGIGRFMVAEVPITLNGHAGTFRKVISDIGDW